MTDSESPANRPFRRLVSQSGVYAINNAAVKASGLVLAPILLNPAYLSLGAYGHYALLMVSAQLGIFVAGLGLSSGLLRFMTDRAYSDKIAALPLTALAAAAVSGIVALAAVTLIDDWIAKVLLDDAGQAATVMLTAGYVVSKAVGGIPLAYVRVREKPVVYTCIVLAEIALLLVGIFLFVVDRGEGLHGLVKAHLLSAATVSILAAVGMLISAGVRFDRSVVAPLIRFGTPLVIAGLSAWVLNAGDRYLLKLLAEASVVGLYEWAARLAGVINMIFVQSFQLAFSVIGLKQLGNDDVSVHRRTFGHYSVITAWAVLGLVLLTPELMVVLVSRFGVADFYSDVDLLVFPLAAGFWWFGIYVVVNNVLYASGRTRIIGRNVLVAAVLNIALNVLLIPWLGAAGAAIATFFSYAALALLTAYAAESVRRVGYPWKNALLALSIAGFLWLMGSLIDGLPLASRLAGKGTILMLFWVLVLAFGIYTPTQIRQGLARIGLFRNGPM